MIVKDWIAEAASEIYWLHPTPIGEEPLTALFSDIIRRHSPFMPVPRCETCRWWKAHSDTVRHMGDCELFECRNKEQVHHESHLIVSRTGSGEATLVTLADFGCVQFEASARD